MRVFTQRFSVLGTVAILLALLLVAAPFSSRVSQAAIYTAQVSHATATTAIKASESAATVPSAAPKSRQVNALAKVPSNSSKGKMIVISLSREWLYAYENGKLMLNAAIMSGRPSLPTPTGTYHVFAKLSPTTFYSPWPQGSPYWYPPTHINYALEWRAGGYFLHDTWWHSVYGPGTNGWHYDPQFGWQWGSHGCVGMPVNVAAWLYHWAPIGTIVQINP